MTHKSYHRYTDVLFQLEAICYCWRMRISKIRKTILYLSHKGAKLLTQTFQHEE